jgi:hypothetical protein
MKAKIDHLRPVFRLWETDVSGRPLRERGAFDTQEDAEKAALRKGLKHWEVKRQ